MMARDQLIQDAEAFVRKALQTMGQDCDEATIQSVGKKVVRGLPACVRSGEAA